MKDKIIVSNHQELESKYGNAGWVAIHKALNDLVAADSKRGINSKIVYLDKNSDMKKLNGNAVMNHLDPLENKKAIDDIFKFYEPHYLMILGSHDIIPHQDINNPVYNRESVRGGGDVHAFGDLPYACDAPYSRDPAMFVGPTRVVGRLPDLVGDNNPSYLICLIKTATKYKTRTPSEYASYLGLSAEIWQGSTQLSLNNIFGNTNKLLLAPPSGPNYPNNELQTLMHFINCHGGLASPEFLGQRGNTYHTALTTQLITGKIHEGTIASAECCYGAQLYDSITLITDKPICQSYLEQGAYGFFGSTTIAYGPPNGNGAADLICQYFLHHVLNGASVGEAALMARQDFVYQTGQMDPIDLKTLSQFNLLGDPSIHPVIQTSATVIPKTMKMGIAEQNSRVERRNKMKAMGSFLTDTKPTASKESPSGKISQQTMTVLSNISKIAGLTSKQEFTVFDVKETPMSKSLLAKDTKISIRYLITIGIPKIKTIEKINQGIAVVARELNGRIVDYRIYHQR
ncbi:hypothetical protein NMT12_90139 [metagenome]